MTTNHGSPGSRNSPAASPAAATKHTRGAYRQQLTAGRPASTTVGPEAKRAAAVILEVLAGVRTPAAMAPPLRNYPKGGWSGNFRLGSGTGAASQLFS